MPSFDNEVIESLMQNGDSREAAEEKLKATKEVLRKADALMETEMIKGVLSSKGDTSIVPGLIQQIADKINASSSSSQSPSPNKRSFDETGYDSEGEDWSTLPGATALTSVSKKAKSMIEKGGKSKKRSNRRRNRRSTRRRRY